MHACMRICIIMCCPMTVVLYNYIRFMLDSLWCATTHAKQAKSMYNALMASLQDPCTLDTEFANSPVPSALVGKCCFDSYTLQLVAAHIWLSCSFCSCALTWQLHSEIVWCSLQPRTPGCHAVRHGRCGVAPRTPGQLCFRLGLSPPEQCSTGNRTNDL